jgi:hypothetical protein
VVIPLAVAQVPAARCHPFAVAAAGFGRWIRDRHTPERESTIEHDAYAMIRRSRTTASARCGARADRSLGKIPPPCAEGHLMRLATIAPARPRERSGCQAVSDHQGEGTDV